MTVVGWTEVLTEVSVCRVVCVNVVDFVLRLTCVLTEVLIEVLTSFFVVTQANIDDRVVRLGTVENTVLTSEVVEAILSGVESIWAVVSL